MVYFTLRMRDLPWHISIRLANIYSILSSINIYPLLNTVLKITYFIVFQFQRWRVIYKKNLLHRFSISALTVGPRVSWRERTCWSTTMARCCGRFRWSSSPRARWTSPTSPSTTRCASWSMNRVDLYCNCNLRRCHHRLWHITVVRASSTYVFLESFAYLYKSQSATSAPTNVCVWPGAVPCNCN